MNSSELLFFGGFILFVLIILSFDLGVFNKKDKEISFSKAGLWTLLWVSLALSFYVLILFYGERLHGIDSMEKLREVASQYRQHVAIIDGDLEESLRNYRQMIALEYLTGYLLEESLSIDNIFVMMLIFTAFGVEKKYYHRVLFWGILGALVFRFIFIFAGAYLVSRFHWLLYIFGAFLLYTGIKMLLHKEPEKITPEKHPVVRFASKFFKVWPHFEGNRFFIRRQNTVYITPLFLVLLLIEFTDLIFAFDSIPAIFAVTKDPYIIFFSNIFAILGLRSLFFVLSAVVDKFHFFKLGLSAILIFIGLKMLMENIVHKIGFTIQHSLMVIVGVLALSVLASLLFPKKK
jgi:tellurite resistance protein TerC